MSGAIKVLPAAPKTAVGLAVGEFAATVDPELQPAAHNKPASTARAMLIAKDGW
jgi:hypothetical protein